ncbi:hypothetical protein PoB_003778600 [Plakobranchus ocellatus]|uniref:Uncharacterized protein n=1 Tax=Plakobranchus ocellatus TaxID=259542 RepID=A0AAV4AXN1_9GAST|nr:hypothetical protein PoB_003778600 [Plakobranchus ocellatus]
MDGSPSETANQTYAPQEDSDLEDLPLAKLKAHMGENMSSSDDDAPLATLVVRPPSPGELSSSDEFVDDKDADPDYQQGISPGEDTTEKEGMQDEDPNMTERQEKVSQEDAVQMPEENVRGRKRHRNEMEWKRTVRKRFRNSGKSYVSSRGKAILAKAMKPPCVESCALKCTQKFSEEERQSIFEDFWRQGDKREQQHFIVRHTEETALKRKRVGSKRRNTTFRYFFYGKEKREQVCRTFFLNTLDIRPNATYRTKRKEQSTGGLKTSLQGKHGCQKKIDDSLIQQVKDHIKSFPIVDSHYCRADSAKKYLDPSLSVARMYRLYCVARDENGQDKVSEDKYRQVFNQSFNLGFHRPKKDQCETCIAHKNNKSANKEEEDNFNQLIPNKNKWLVRPAANTALSSWKELKLFLQKKAWSLQFDNL